MKSGVVMNANHVSNSIVSDIVTEINSIWIQASIQFDLIDVRRPEGVSNEQLDMLRYLTIADRNETVIEREMRLEAYRKLTTGHTKPRDDSLNVYIIPYAGITHQGNAMGRGISVMVGAYTDKISRGKNPPQKATIREERPFVKGSISRTIAHELGHTFNLNHTTQGLMSSKGYILSKEEARKAIRTVKILSNSLI